jgi:hypothetical protein
LKLATLGFGDALDSISDPQKFAEALKQLSPNAQQAALSIQALLPAFNQLKNATQDAFFANIAPQLNQLASTLMPTVQRLTTGVADAFNEMFTALGQELLTPQMQASLSDITTNIVAAFHDLVPAIAPVTSAFGDLISVGSEFLPDIAKGAASAAQAFADFVHEAKESGKLHEWIGEGLDTLQQLGSTLPGITGAFLSLADVGRQQLPGLVDTINGITGAVKELSGWLSTAADLLDIITLHNPIQGVKGLIQGHDQAPPSLGNAGLGTATTNLLAPPGIFSTPGSPVGPAAPPGGALSVLPNAPGGTPAGTPGIFSTPASPTVPGVPPGGYNVPTTGPTLGSSVLGPPRTDYFGNPMAPKTFGPTGPTWGDPGPANGGGPGGPAASGPTVPYGGDPMSLLQGFPVTSSLYSAAGGVLEAQNKVAQTQSDLNALLSKNTATESEIQDKRNDLVKAQQDQQAAELRLLEAKQSSTEKFSKQVQGATEGLNALSAGLDKDLGLSKGLAGLADNLVRFIGNLATAPLQAKLQQQIQANPNEGSGIVGIMAAQGAFGPQYTPQGIAAQNGQGYNQGSYGPSGPGYAPSGYPGMAPPGTPQPGESARDFAHRVMMPFWQSQGFQVGDHAADKYGEHQNGALDVMVDSLAQGNQVLQQVLSDPNVYGAIFNNQTYGYGHGTTPQDYSAGHTGNPTQDHQDHVHAFYKPGGANNIMPPPMSPGLSPQQWNNIAGVPSVPGGPPGSGMPQAAPFAGGPQIAPSSFSPGYAPTQQPQAAPGWQPGAKGVGGGGIIGAAAGAAAGMFPGGGAAAQIAMQMIQRTIQYGGEVAGALVQGGLDTLSVSDPDGGPGASLNDSWLGRLGGALASAAPALPTTAGKADQQQQPQNPVDPNTTQHGTGKGQPPGPLIGTMNVQADKATGQHMANELAYASAASGMTLPVP